MSLPLDTASHRATEPRQRQAFDGKPLPLSGAVATADIRFVATDTLGSTTDRKGVWTLVLEEQDGAWTIVADHRTMAFVPLSH